MHPRSLLTWATVLLLAAVLADQLGRSGAAPAEAGAAAAAFVPEDAAPQAPQPVVDDGEISPEDWEELLRKLLHQQGLRQDRKRHSGTMSMKQIQSLYHMMKVG